MMIYNILKKMSSLSLKKLKATSTIALLGIFLGLKIMLQLFATIYLGPTIISFTWVILIATGFIYGPFIGLFFGLISDSLGYALHPDVYMWEYSIQEPLIAMTAGFFGFIFENYQGHKWLNLLFFQLFLHSFLIIALVIVIISKPIVMQNLILSKGLLSKMWYFLNNKMVMIILLTSFYIVINAFVTLMVLKKSKTYRLYIYTSMAIILTWICWSWLEGPWAQMHYWKIKFPTWNYSDQNTIATTKRWLFNIRVFKAILIVPIEIFLTTSILWAYFQLPNQFKNWW